MEEESKQMNETTNSMDNLNEDIKCDNINYEKQIEIINSNELINYKINDKLEGENGNNNFYKYIIFFIIIIFLAFLYLL